MARLLNVLRYLRTIDICHDHFGFYLAWGSAVWLPTMYTLQSQYLARYPVQLSPWAAALIFTIGVSGYALFRSVNFQKDIVRRTNGECTIWGKKAKVMRCRFKTADGRDHQTLLLLSGKSEHFPHYSSFCWLADALPLGHIPVN